MKLRLLVLCFVATLGLVPVSLAFATSASSISVDVAPPNPGPFENTTITLSSFSANLDSVLIKWFVDGKMGLSGTGEKSFSVSAPKSGSQTRIDAKIFLPDGEIDKTIVIKPSIMILLWQANDSYVPPFYKGKAMPGADSEIKIVAMPEIRNGSGNVSPKNMTYSWKKDYTNIPDDSGYGKNYLLYTNDYLENSSNVSVVASTLDQQSSSESNITVGSVLPKILFYKQDNEMGTLWEKALQNGHNVESDEIIVAAPYFISPKDIRRPELVFSWFINHNPVDVSIGAKNIMPVKVQSGTSGTSTIGLQIVNKYRIFETANKELNVNF